jgi:hypothetical protein
MIKLITININNTIIKIINLNSDKTFWKLKNKLNNGKDKKLCKKYKKYKINLIKDYRINIIFIILLINHFIYQLNVILTRIKHYNWKKNIQIIQLIQFQVYNIH